MDRDTSPTRLVIVGRVVAARGPRGEVQVDVISDSPDRFSAGGFLYLNDQPHRIQSSSMLPKGRVSLKLEGINSRSEAESLRGNLLMVPEGMVPPLAEGDYYHFQIVDMHVYTEEGEYLGQITQILSTGSNDVYVVSRGGEELLIPAVDEVIKEVDVEKAVMTVELPGGLKAEP